MCSYMALLGWVKQLWPILSPTNECWNKSDERACARKPGDLAGLLTNLEEGDILFIDEIHRLSAVVEEYLYSAMEDYKIDIMIDSGPNARSVQIAINPFTLVGATTRSGLLTAPLRARFGINSRLEYYDSKLLTDIVIRSAGILNVPIEE